MRDEELDELLKSLHDEKPADLQMRKWKNAVRAETSRGSAHSSMWKTQWMQLAAACLVGFLIGALVFGGFWVRDELGERFAQYDFENATVDHVMIKTN